MSDLPHLRLEETAQGVGYTFAGGGGSGAFSLPPRDRRPHAEKLRQELEAAEGEAEARRAQEGPGESKGDVIAVRSERDFELKLDSLERLRSGIELLSVKVEGGVTTATVFVPRGKYVRLLALIDAYEQKQSSRGRPRNRELIESIAAIKLAALRDSWQDELPFPTEDERLWWEVWLRRGGEEASRGAHERFSTLAKAQGLRVSEQHVAFPERVVTLAYGTQSQISASLDVLSLIAEVRRAKELSTDYLELPPREQAEVIQELVDRLRPPAADAPAVCILDTGVNRQHPLIEPALSQADTQTVNVAWGSADDARLHGTEMSGIALYGSLTDVFSSNDPVELRHRLESVKFLPPGGSNAPKDYGPFTIQAISIAEIQAPTRNRAVCMAVTADDRDLGMPSLWSAAVDQLTSGAFDDDQRLMFVSAGNVRGDEFGVGYVYPRTNCEREGIEDPGQAWNVVTVGAYTEKVVIRDQSYAGWSPIAPAGDLTPTSRTSLPWPDENQRGWPLKPDIVMEGGNYAQLGNERDHCSDLALLTTTLRPDGRLVQAICDTSPATAAAARMAAIIWSRYPRLRPETVRALMVHSAEWTPAMAQRFPGQGRTAVHKRLRCYGYGVPNLQRALWSAENAATLIYEGEVQPYTRRGSEVRSNEMHLHTLPWPAEVLEDLGETDVGMRVTLSYFIEPSPGRIGWKRRHRYQSHGLRFDVKRPTEDEQAFRQRISREEWDDPQARPESVRETRNWVIGEGNRTRGSVHSDRWTGTATELASCGQIVVHPVTGWWRERPHLGRVNKLARYSLVVSIEAPGVDVDLYTAIETQTTVRTEIVTE